MINGLKATVQFKYYIVYIRAGHVPGRSSRYDVTQGYSFLHAHVTSTHSQHLNFEVCTDSSILLQPLAAE